MHLNNRQNAFALLNMLLLSNRLISHERLGSIYSFSFWELAVYGQCHCKTRSHIMLAEFIVIFDGPTTWKLCYLMSQILAYALKYLICPFKSHWVPEWYEKSIQLMKFKTWLKLSLHKISKPTFFCLGRFEVYILFLSFKLFL